MNFIELIKTKWQNLKNWYTELIEIISELFKYILLSLPKLILGILGFFLFFYSVFKIGWWWTLLIYFILMFVAIWIYDKYIKKKTNNLDPSSFVGKRYSSKYGEIITTVIKVADKEFDEKGNRIYLCQTDENYMSGNVKSHQKNITALRLYRKVILTKEWTETK